MRKSPPPNVTRLFLARHGATASNERQPYILQGCEINGPLTVRGEEQARCMGEFLKDFDVSAVYASPLMRAVQTATAVAVTRGLQVETVHDLRECSVGRWEGRDWDTIRREDPDGYDRFFGDPVNQPHPGGESYRDVMNRVQPAMLQILEKHQGRNVLVVAHNLVNRVYLAEMLGLELRHARKVKQSNACLNVLEHRDGTTELITLNSVMHLPVEPLLPK